MARRPAGSGGTPRRPPAYATLLARFSAYDEAVLGSAANTVRNRRIYLAAFLTWWVREVGRGLATASPADIAGFLVASPNGA